MLQQLEVFHPGVITPPLPIVDGSPASDPLQIRGIDGLDPVTASVNTFPLGSLDEESLAGASVGKRVIVVTVGLNPDWVDQSMSSLRHILYRYFMPKAQVRLRFTHSELPVVDISGIVESFSPNIFSNDPEIDVSIVCPASNFVSIDPIVVMGKTTSVLSSDYTEINYEGNVQTGFVVLVEKGDGPDLNGEVRIINASPNQEVMLLQNIIINSAQYLDLSTVTKDKYARKGFIGGGPPQSTMGSVALSSTWSPLRPGLNKFRVQTSTPGQNWTLRYHNRYGGL